MAVQISVTKATFKVGNKVQLKEYDTPTAIVLDGDVVYLPVGANDSIAINTKTGASFENEASISAIATGLSATDLTSTT